MSKHSSCPFCGSKENQTVTDDGIGWVKCNGCGATGPIFSKYSGEEDQEYISWESRAEAQALREEVARLDRESQSLSSQLGACDRERLRFQSQAAALHASMVDAELLRRIVEEQPAVQDIGEMINWQRARDQAIEELRELLGEGKEVGDVLVRK